MQFTSVHGTYLLWHHRVVSVSSIADIGEGFVWVCRVVDKGDRRERGWDVEGGWVDGGH